MRMKSVIIIVTEIGYGRVVDDGDHDRQETDENGQPEGASA